MKLKYSEIIDNIDNKINKCYNNLAIIDKEITEKNLVKENIHAKINLLKNMKYEWKIDTIYEMLEQ